MASWMVHLRVADKLLDCLADISFREFVMGNIAPDSGLPNEDWTAYFPDKRTSHFQVQGPDGRERIQIESFVDQYFTPALRQGYTKEQYAFFLGYLTHLLTDVEWARCICLPCMDKHMEEQLEDKHKFLWAMKADWYDLDFLYFKKHPDFRAFHIYENAQGFVNTYMDIFAEDAFDRRRGDIAGFYRGGRDNLEREYPYLTEGEADAFVGECAEAILGKLKELHIGFGYRGAGVKTTVGEEE